MTTQEELSPSYILISEDIKNLYNPPINIYHEEQQICLLVIFSNYFPFDLFPWQCSLCIILSASSLHSVFLDACLNYFIFNFLLSQ